MKKSNFIIAAILILVSTLANAQTKSGFEYFNGKWSILANGPYGEVKMVVGFEKKADKIISTINDSEGKELYKVEKTSIEGNRATITFVGSQGPVDMVITRKDDDHLAGDIMNGVASVTGERIMEKKLQPF